MAASSHRASAMPASSHRHHPYAPSSSAGAGPSSSRAPAPATTAGRKWATSSGARSPERRPLAPPSPPRSRRDHSESPPAPAGLGAAFGGREGGKWWDEEIPAPPSSLSSILDSFRRSGEGDRDLLLAILGAKKAEEERLTALIQTRLTILQARLNVHAAATSTTADPASYAPERTPSLTSRGSASSSTGPISPADAPPNPQALYASYDRTMDKRSSPGAQGEAFHLPPPTNLWRRSPSALGVDNLPPIKIHRGSSSRGRSSPVSPRSDGHPGLDMLIDAGRRMDTRAE